MMRSSRGTRARELLFRGGWPLAWLFLGFPLWWLLGLSAFVPVLVAAPMSVELWRARPFRIPWGFYLWVAFVAWVLVSAIQLQTWGGVLTYSYRLGYYVAGGIAFLYVVTFAGRTGFLPRLVRILTLFWMILIVFGLLAAVLPSVHFPSLIEPLIPGALLKNDLLHRLVHPTMANIQHVIGQSIARPAAPFPYTNWWGGNVAAMLPYVFFDLAISPSRRWRYAILVMLVLSLVPTIYSLNRAMWLSMVVAAVAFGIVAVRDSGVRRVAGATRDGMRRLAARLRTYRWEGVGLLALLVFTAGLFVFLPNLALTRLSSGGSAGFRLWFLSQAGSVILDSPVFGHGVPQKTGEIAMRLGTQGQFWLVLVTAGIPGAAAFVGWILANAWRALRNRRVAEVLVGALVILIVAIQLPFYNIINVELITLMIGAALVWGRHGQDPMTTPP